MLITVKLLECYFKEQILNVYREKRHSKKIKKIIFLSEKVGKIVNIRT